MAESNGKRRRRATSARGKATRKRRRRRVRNLDHLQTPPHVVDAIAAFRAIGLDAFGQGGSAASAAAADYWTRGALQRRWDGRGLVYVQPPYSRGWLAPSMRKAEAEGDEVIALVPAATDTAWWHDHVVPAAAAALFFRGRLQFYYDGEPMRDASGKVTGGWFASALVYYATSTDPSYAARFRRRFCELGWTVALGGVRRVRQLRVPGS